MLLTQVTTWAVLTLGQASAPAEAPFDEALVPRGIEVYAAQRCAACHSIAGVGNKKSPLDGVGSKLSPDQLRKWIVAPREMDPKVRKRAYDKLAPKDLDALVMYMRSLTKKAP